MEFFPKKKPVNEEEIAARAAARLEEAQALNPNLVEEEGAEEGDWTDYTMPLKGAGTKSAQKAGLAFLRSMGFSKEKEKRPPPLTKYERKKPAPGSIDYSKQMAEIKAKGPGESKTKLVYDKFGNPKEVPNS